MSSEDVIFITCDEYTPEQSAEVEERRKGFGILRRSLKGHHGYATVSVVASICGVANGIDEGQRDRQEKIKASPSFEAARSPVAYPAMAKTKGSVNVIF